MDPVPGYGVSTPFGRRGTHWSCQKVNGRGIHTGLDIAAPKGTWIVAPIDGQIRWRRYGSAFGPYQFAISPDPGQPFGSGEVFFAHTLDRLRDGTRVKAGQRIARVGALGNVTGPHLHMEYMPKTKNTWRCGIHANPQTIIDWKPKEADVAAWLKYSGKPSGVLRVPTGRYVTVDVQIPAPPKGGVKEDRLVYLNVKPTWKLPKSDPLYWFQTANIRVRWQRAPHNGKKADDTAYQDFTVTPWESEFLLTHLHWETSEKGRGGKWHLKIKGHVTSAVVGTRYSKGAI